MAGAETWNGSDSSATVMSPLANRASICLRVGSERAKKVSSSWRLRELNKWLIAAGASYRVKAEVPSELTPKELPRNYKAQSMEQAGVDYGTGNLGFNGTFEDFSSIVAEWLRGRNRRKHNKNSHLPLGQVAAREWRRRELNPRPAMHPRWRLRV